MRRENTLNTASPFLQVKQELKLFRYIARGAESDVQKLRKFLRNAPGMYSFQICNKRFRRHLYDPTDPRSILNRKNSNGLTPLFIATMNGNINVAPRRVHVVDGEAAAGVQGGPIHTLIHLQSGGRVAPRNRLSLEPRCDNKVLPGELQVGPERAQSGAASLQGQGHTRRYRPANLGGDQGICLCLPLLLLLPDRRPCLSLGLAFIVPLFLYNNS